MPPFVLVWAHLAVGMRDQNRNHTVMGHARWDTNEQRRCVDLCRSCLDPRI